MQETFNSASMTSASAGPAPAQPASSGSTEWFKSHALLIFAVAGIGLALLWWFKRKGSGSSQDQGYPLGYPNAGNGSSGGSSGVGAGSAGGNGTGSVITAQDLLDAQTRGFSQGSALTDLATATYAQEVNTLTGQYKALNDQFTTEADQLRQSNLQLQSNATQLANETSALSGASQNLHDTQAAYGTLQGMYVGLQGQLATAQQNITTLQQTNRTLTNQVIPTSYISTDGAAGVYVSGGTITPINSTQSTTQTTGFGGSRKGLRAS